MKTRTAIGCCVTALAFFAGCDDKPPITNYPPPPPRPAPTPKVAAVNPVEKPIELKKPVVLGPVVPALVLLPDHIPEPQIRVRLTEEQDRPPAVAAAKYHGRIESLRLADGKYVAIN